MQGKEAVITLVNGIPMSIDWTENGKARYVIRKVERIYETALRLMNSGWTIKSEENAVH